MGHRGDLAAQVAGFLRRRSRRQTRHQEPCRHRPRERTGVAGLIHPHRQPAAAPCTEDLEAGGIRVPDLGQQLDVQKPAWRVAVSRARPKAILDLQPASVGLEEERGRQAGARALKLDACTDERVGGEQHELGTGRDPSRTAERAWLLECSPVVVSEDQRTEVARVPSVDQGIAERPAEQRSCDARRDEIARHGVMGERRTTSPRAHRRAQDRVARRRQEWPRGAARPNGTDGADCFDRSHQVHQATSR